MPEAQRTIVINCPAEQVFAFFTDHGSRRHAMPSRSLRDRSDQKVSSGSRRQATTPRSPSG
jgi:hypothetical protein